MQTRKLPPQEERSAKSSTRVKDIISTTSKLLITSESSQTPPDTFLDICFEIESKYIHASKAFLVATSDFFRTMLLQNSHSSLIKILDCRFPIFKALLHYLFCGKIQLDNYFDLAELLLYGRRHQIAELLQVSLSANIQKIVDEKRLAESLLFLDFYVQGKEFQKEEFCKLLAICKSHLNELIRSPYLYNCSKELILYIFEMKDIEKATFSEAFLFEKARCWTALQIARQNNPNLNFQTSLEYTQLHHSIISAESVFFQIHIPDPNKRDEFKWIAFTVDLKTLREAMQLFLPMIQFENMKHDDIEGVIESSRLFSEAELYKLNKVISNAKRGLPFKLFDQDFDTARPKRFLSS